MRGVSTVLDVAVFLLLVTAAIATVTLPVSPTPETDVGSVAGTLGTVTTDVAYPLSVVVAFDNGTETTLSTGRRANGTVANLLADAAVSSARLGPPDGNTRSGGYRRAVANRTRAVLRWFDAHIQVEAVWRPYVGAPLSGNLTVGPAPPRSDRMVATLEVPAPVDAIRARAIRAAAGGYGSVATVVANATVRGLYPPRRMELALHAGGLARGLAIRRYRRLLDGLETNVSRPLRTGAVHEVNRALAAALADAFATDMRGRFDTPVAAAAAVRAGRVRIVVRGWDP